MQSSENPRTNRDSNANSCPATIALVFFLLLGMTAQGQTFRVLYNFTGQADGGNPESGVSVDATGNIYGTTSFWGTGGTCGYGGCGIVYRLAHSSSVWHLTPLYNFQGGTDGRDPTARVTFGPHGVLYGTTQDGGSYDRGTVFAIRPATNLCRTGMCGYSESVTYSFGADLDASAPWAANLVFDSSGNLYGTTFYGGTYGAGTIYKLSPSNGGWSESVLYSFTGGDDGWGPLFGVALDNNGSLYGTTIYGGDTSCLPPTGCGTVFRLHPSGQGWVFDTLHVFHGLEDGGSPVNVLVGRSGNLYGMTNLGGASGMGTAFRLTETSGRWTYDTLYNFTQDQGFPSGEIALDSSENLYGTSTHVSGWPSSVFKLPSGSWAYTSLHEFGGMEGSGPNGVTLDSSGNLYGSCASGGQGYPYVCFGPGCGTVWEMTRQ